MEISPRGLIEEWAMTLDQSATEWFLLQELHRKQYSAVQLLIGPIEMSWPILLSFLLERFQHKMCYDISPEGVYLSNKEETPSGPMNVLM